MGEVGEIPRKILNLKKEPAVVIPGVPRPLEGGVVGADGDAARARAKRALINMNTEEVLAAKAADRARRATEKSVTKLPTVLPGNNGVDIGQVIVEPLKTGGAKEFHEKDEEPH